MSDIIVDTCKLKSYADRIDRINSRITRIDARLDHLYCKVGLQGLFELIQLDYLVGYSWSLSRCSSYLNKVSNSFKIIEDKIQSQDPTTFNKQHLYSVKDYIHDIGVGVKKAAKNVKSRVQGAIAYVCDIYNSQGTLYKIVQYGKATLKAAKGVSKIMVGVVSIVGGAGLTTPVAWLTIISGCNDFANALFDGAYIYTKQYDKIGQKNFLKDSLVERGGMIGSFLGNEKFGRAFGSITYFGIDLVTSLAALDVSIHKIRQLSSTNFVSLGNELKEIAQLDVSGLFTNFENLRYKAKLASYTFSATTNLITNVGALYDVGGKSVTVGKSIYNILTVNASEDENNSIVEFFDSASNITNKITTGKQHSAKLAKFVRNPKDYIFKSLESARNNYGDMMKLNDMVYGN